MFEVQYIQKKNTSVPTLKIGCSCVQDRIIGTIRIMRDNQSIQQTEMHHYHHHFLFFGGEFDMMLKEQQDRLPTCCSLRHLSTLTVTAPFHTL